MSLSFLGTLATTLLGKILPNSKATAEAQNKLNEAEIANAPSSILRLWRSFLLWVLTLLFVWEVVGRSIVVTYFPDAKIPPSTLDIITPLLFGAMGLGF